MPLLLFLLFVGPTNGNGGKNKMITAESEGFPGKTSDLAPTQLSCFKREEKSCPSNHLSGVTNVRF